MSRIILRVFDAIIAVYSCFYLGIFFTTYEFLGISVSNIAVPTLILVCLLLLRWLIQRQSFSHLWPIRQITKVANLSDRLLLTTAMLLLFLLFTLLSQARHLSFSSGAFDLGIFDQAIWSASRGALLFSSIKGNMSLLGDHFGPILFVIAPIYKLWPNVLALFIIQSALLSCAIIPLYLIAKERLRLNRPLIFAFIISYLLSRPLRGVGLSDFHPECFILCALFWMYYFLLRKKNLWLWLMVLILLLSKEDNAFLLSGMGVFAFFLPKRRLLGISLFALGIAWWVIATKLLIPHFNPLHQYDYMSRLPFGLTYADNIKAIAQNPAGLFALLFEKAKVSYLLKLFGPLLLLPLLSPSHYILIAIPILKNILPTDVNFSGFYRITAHYTASIIPFLYISAIYGAGRVISWMPQKKTAKLLSLLIILSALLFYGKTDAYKLSRFVKEIRHQDSFTKLAYLKKIIPPDASVCANFSLVAHLSQRKYIFEWSPTNIIRYPAEYAVIDRQLLEYLPKEVEENLPLHFAKMRELGYTQIFASPDNTLFIFHNKLTPYN